MAWAQIRQKARYVPGKWLITRGPGGFSQRRWQPGHYALPSGAWVSGPARPGNAAAAAGAAAGGAAGAGGGAGAPGDTGGYHGLTDAEMAAKANQLADAQIAASSAKIKAQQAAAAAQGRRDVATQTALGGAQMGMISKIPENIQGIRNTAGQAISDFGNQVSGAAAGQLQGEQGAAGAFEAAQTGMGPAAPQEAAPGQAAGVNAQAALAASAQMGGTIPARQQAEVGAASAIAAEGMPAVVARATQDQVAMRMTDAATEDEKYRQQLIDLAATRGGIYQDAYNNLIDVESKKFGQWEAEQRLKLDQQQFAYAQEKDKNDRIAQHDAFLAQQVAAGQKTKAQAAKDKRNYDLSVRRVEATEAGVTLRADQAHAVDSAKSKVVGYQVDSTGQPILDANGKKIPVAKTGAAKPPKGGVKTAASMAKAARGKPDKVGVNDKGQKTVQWNTPNKSYAAAKAEIIAALKDSGYTQAQAVKIATAAVNSAYGPGVGGRPGVRRHGPGNK